MVFRELKEKINKFTRNLLLKSYDLSKDKRLTQKPSYEIFFNDRPGIKHPEITPTLPLLLYVHNNSPPIKIATMRLRESIFRRGFEWERKFESKCSDCKKEFEDVVQQCDACGSKNIKIPDKNEIKRADKFFKQCNIYDPHIAGKRKLLHLLKQIEDDINIYDDAYLIGVKEYWQDSEGDIKLTTLHQILRGNPVTMRLVADEYGEPGGRYFTCLRHRDVIEEVADKKCTKCGRRLYEVHYVSVEGGGDNPMAYYIGDEVIHVSKYSPSALYGFSPIVTLWQYCLTLTNMVEYIYRSYSEAHLPKGILAMRTSNPDAAFEFWRDVDDKLNKDPHYIPKMFLEGDGNGTGSGMEFVKFMDTLEEMQFIPVRDEIRRTIASLYGVTNIFIGDTSGIGGINSEDTQIDITNMAAESGIAIYNDHIMPELLKWLNINDWNYVLQSPFEENKQRELNENQSKVNIMQSMLQAGFDVALGEEDIFEFKYSGAAKKQDTGGGFSGFGGQDSDFSANPEEGTPGFNESDIKMGLEKSRIYVKHPNEAPQGSKIQRSESGAYYYDTTPQRPHEEILSMNKRRRVETLLHSATEHYENLLEEYKHSKDVNPGHAMSLQGDLQETRQMIRELQNNYKELFGDQPEMEKDLEGRNININIQKYLGESPDNAEALQFQKELNKIFDEEISKILNSTKRFSGDDIKVFTKQVLDDAIWKMRVHTNRHIRKLYDSGQAYVGELVGKSLDFSKVDEMAIKAITERKVLWNAYANMEKELSKNINDIITESYKDPKTFSIHNMVNKMREATDAETYRLERIVRTETRTATQKGREMGFKKVDTEGKYRYNWAVRHDSRTSDVCKEIEEIVKSEGGGRGVTLDRLNEILKTVSLKHNGENWEYRDWTPHINCRSGIVRSFVEEPITKSIISNVSNEIKKENEEKKKEEREKIEKEQLNKELELTNRKIELMEKLSNDITKEKIYVNSIEDAPEGTKVQTGKRGGLFYESKGRRIKATSHNRYKLSFVGESEALNRLGVSCCLNANRSLKWNSPIDLIDENNKIAYEVKTFSKESKDIKVKTNIEIKNRKEAWAKENSYTLKTLVVLYDKRNNTTEGYIRDGYGGYRITNMERLW